MDTTTLDRMSDDQLWDAYYAAVADIKQIKYAWESVLIGVVPPPTPPNGESVVDYYRRCFNELQEIENLCVGEIDRRTALRW